jgi:hypothetical protein
LPSALPQSAQNLAPGALSELHFEQRFDSRLLHSAQNFLPGIPSVPHFEQRMCPPDKAGVSALLGITMRCAPHVAKATRAINVISGKQAREPSHG